MEISYNACQGLVVIKYPGGLSTFKLDRKVAAQIEPLLMDLCFPPDGKTRYPLTFVEVSKTVYNRLYDAHSNQLFRYHKGWRVPKNADIEHVETLIKAWESGKPVQLEYVSGYGVITEGQCSHDGTKHRCWVGRTAGRIKEFLHLERKEASGGMCLGLHGIKRLTLIS